MPDEILTAAVEIARTAGAVAAERFRTGSPISRKADGTEVTPADVEVERLIRRLVGQRFPGDQVYGEEEGGATSARAGRRWIIDPINGTTMFARQLPGFDLLLAVEQDGEPAAGSPTSPAATCWPAPATCSPATATSTASSWISSPACPPAPVRIPDRCPRADQPPSCRAGSREGSA